MIVNRLYLKNWRNFQHVDVNLFTDAIQGRVLEDDPFGQGFLERIAKTNERTRRSRLKTIEKALKIAVPQLQQLDIYA